MAQLVEQRIRNAQVVGSSPTISSRQSAFAGCFFIITKPPDARTNIGRLIIRNILFDFGADCLFEQSFDFCRGFLVNK